MEQDRGKSIAVIWIDREHAKVFHVSHDNMEIKHFEAGQISHHTHAENSFDQKRREGLLFYNVATSLSDSIRILILGPGVAKYHFQNYLGEHFPALSRLVVGCKVVDHPSDPQIAAYGKRFLEDRIE